jgi:hypothetical protein
MSRAAQKTIAAGNQKAFGWRRKFGKYRLVLLDQADGSKTIPQCARCAML